MPSLNIFRTPKEIIWGRGGLSHLSKFSGHKALIICGPNLAKRGPLEEAKHCLEKSGHKVAVFSQVEPEPSIHNVMEIIRNHKAFNPDIIVGLGGGSPMDASKAFQIFYEHPRLTFENVRFYGGPPQKAIPPYRKSILICIPSTSGSAAEVTPSALITDPTIPAKCTIHSPELVPHVAIIDPDLADSMPKSLQADTACDALTHAVAGYANLNGNTVTREFCLQATKILLENIPEAYDGDQKAKEQVHYAATIAGLGFGNCGLGVEHPIASMVGASFHLPHGRACSTALPYVVRFNATVVGELYAKLAQGIGFEGTDTKKAVDFLIKAILDTKRHLKMPDKFQDTGIPEDEYLKALSGFTEKTFGLIMYQVNPRQCTAEEMVALYKNCYYGHLGI